MALPSRQIGMTASRLRAVALTASSASNTGTMVHIKQWSSSAMQALRALRADESWGDHCTRDVARCRATLREALLTLFHLEGLLQAACLDASLASCLWCQVAPAVYQSRAATFRNVQTAPRSVLKPDLSKFVGCQFDLDPRVCVHAKSEA